MANCWKKTEEFFERFDPNEYIERAMGGLGYYVGLWPKISLAFVLAMVISFISCIRYFEAEQDIFDLWTPTNDDSHKERKFIDEYWENNDYGLLAIAAIGKKNEDLLDVEYLREWFDLHLLLKREMPSKKYHYTDRNGVEKSTEFAWFADRYYDVPSLDWISNRTGEYAKRYTSEIVPLCRPFATSPFEAQFIMPCFMLHIFDCFAEGGFAFPYEDYLAKTFFSVLLSVNPYMFNPSFQGLTSVELGAILGPSCLTPVGRRTPSNYIYGGEKRIDKDDDTSAVTSLKGYESVFYIDSGFNIRKKMQIIEGLCTYTSFFSLDCPTPTDKEVDDAYDFQDQWMGKVIDEFIDLTDKWNKKGNKDRKLELSFFTPRSGRDLLKDASRADFLLLGIAYVVMIIFAALTALKPKDLFISRSEASACGVVLVLLAVFACMGLGAVFWKFSPNVVQVLPFIALGFGVDDMFVLLFSFHFREDATVAEMMESTVRIAGSSVALTSTANLSAFAIATSMVLPDVARFALFGTLMVVINFITVLIGFTAMLALVATRMKLGYNDWAWCCCFAEFTKAQEIKSEKPSTHDASIFDPLFDFLTRDDIRIIAVCMFFGMAGVGIYGSTLVRVGLPLAEIVPEDSYASDFLAVREDYFHSYIMSIYSDAKLNKYKPIDWPNQFYAWYNASTTIYDISKLVYRDPGVHAMWAWGFQSYYKENYETYFSGAYALEPEFVVPLSAEFYRSSQCESDRQTYCQAYYAQYGYGTPLWNCLQYNLANLADECAGYISQTTPPASTFTIARQVEILSADDESVEGVYSAPSGDTTNVFYRESDGAALFQRYDLTWAVLDSSNNLIRFSGSTTTDSQPPQANWYTVDGEPAPMTIIYYDLTYFYVGAKRGSEFKLSDDPPRSSFGYTSSVSSGSSNAPLCLGLEVMQKSMEDTTAFQKVTLKNSAGAISMCDAILDSTEICLSIYSEQHPIGETLKCGSLEVGTQQTAFYVGNCSETFTIAAANETGGADLTSEDACYCTTGTDANDYTMNIIQPCGGTNYGGFNLDTSGSPSCQSQSTSVTVQCDKIASCSTLQACYDDIEHGNPKFECSGGDISNYASSGNSQVLAECLLRTYGITNGTDLTDCCKQATREQLIYQMSCAQLSHFSHDNEEVCGIVDQCDDTCNEICYADVSTDLAVIADCDTEITRSCSAEYASGDSDLLRDCLTPLKKKSSCCQSTLVRDNVTYYDCLVPKATQWDYSSDKYTFDECSTADLAAEGCDSGGETTRRNCMVAAYEADPSAFPDGCCKRAISLISTSYIFTRDCEGDALRYCNMSTAYATDSCWSSLTGRIGSGELSDNCDLTLTNCPATDGWSVTAVGDTDWKACDAGYGGNQTRACGNTQYGAQWGEVDTSGCSILSCAAETDSEGQSWPTTQVGKVASFIGFSGVAYGHWSSAGCATTTVPYVSRLCSTSDADGSAEWRNPFVQCRPYYNSWAAATDGQENIICTPYVPTFGLLGHSNIILALPQYLFDDYEDWIENCQDACSLGFPHCQGFYIFNETSSLTPLGSQITSGRTCFIFDWCEQLDASALGSVGEFYWFDNPVSISEFVATLCEAFSKGDDDPSNDVTTSTVYTSQGIPAPICFNMTLWQYLVDPLGGVLSSDSFLVNNRTYLYTTDGIWDLQMVATKSAVNFRGIDDDEVAVEFIGDFRDHLDKYFHKKKLHCIPGGLVINLYSQYIGVEGYLVLNLAFVSIAVVVTGFIFLLHPVAVGVVLLCDAVMIIEVYGFVDWAGLRINGVLALNLVIAIGLTMEFTAHMARAFMIASAGDGEKIGIPQAGPGQIRMKKCLREMFTPVSLGAVTTFLGVSPISAAQFPYFRQYYFVLYVLIVMFGWVNGVIFLPIIMSILNPKFCGKTSEEEHHGIHHDAHLEMVKSTSQYNSTTKEDSKERGLVEAEPVTSGTITSDDGGEGPMDTTEPTS